MKMTRKRESEGDNYKPLVYGNCFDVKNLMSLLSNSDRLVDYTFAALSCTNIKLLAPNIENKQLLYEDEFQYKYKSEY